MSETGNDDRKRKIKMVGGGCLALLLASCCLCGGGGSLSTWLKTSDMHESVDVLLEHARSGNVGAAYQMMAPEYRDRVDLDDFQRAARRCGLTQATSHEITDGGAVSPLDGGDRLEVTLSRGSRSVDGEFWVREYDGHFYVRSIAFDEPFCRIAPPAGTPF